MSTAPVTAVNANPGVLGSTYTTPAVSPAANTRAVVWVTFDKASLLASKPTITGDNHVAIGAADPNWHELGDKHTSNATNPDLWIVGFISDDFGASPPVGLTVTVAATGARAGTASIDTVLSADTNGTALQVASGEDLTTGDPSFTFGSTPGANNLVIGCNWHGGGNAITKPTGYTNMYDNTPTNVTARRHEVFYDNTSAAIGPNQSTSGNQRSLVLAFELAPAGAATQNINAVLFTNTQSFKTAVITTSYNIQATKFDNVSSFKTALISSTYSIQATKHQNNQSFGAATVTTGPVAISASLFTNVNQFKSATIQNMLQIIQCHLFTNVNQFFTSHVTQSGGGGGSGDDWVLKQRRRRGR